jgi:CxxC motif-containing protein
MEKRILTCIGCPLGCTLTAVSTADGYDISGYTCKRGLEYAKKELTRPERTVTSTVRVSGGMVNVTSVRTAADVPKDAIFAVMDAINAIVAPAPIAIGDVICENIAGTGVALTATKAVKAK